jgi:fibronectin type 3 domain-containing protein
MQEHTLWVFTVAIAFMSAIVWAQEQSAEHDWANHPENQWIRQSPREGVPVPKISYEGSASYDPYSKKWIHHAGHDGIPQGFHTFSFDLHTGVWEQKFPSTSPPGVCCVDGTNVFDVAHRRFVRFPGGSLGHGYQWSRGVFLKESAVWLYDLSTNTWTNMRPPPYRRPEKYSLEAIGGLCSAATYDEHHELAISFGGTGAGGAKNALFIYDVYSNALHHIEAANPPPRRDGMGLAYDAKHDKLVMFGSQYLSDEQTWLYDFHTNRWEAYDLEPRPPGKKLETYSTNPKMAYDSINGVVLCIVRIGDEGHETWVFDTGRLQWTKMNPLVEPVPSRSRSRNLSFIAEDNLFILETSAGETTTPEIWTYRYRNVEAKTAIPAPPSNVDVVTVSGGAKLIWTVERSAGIKEYNIYRAQADKPWETEFVKIGTTHQTRFEDKGLMAGSNYFYTVTTVGEDGSESNPSFRVRTSPRVLIKPVVSALAAGTVEVRWNAHPASDVIGYNVYRGLVTARTVRKGTPQAWRDNDPEYAEPMIVQVQDITNIQRLNSESITGTTLTDKIDLTKRGTEAPGYRYVVYAYIIRAVNRLGTESGPSPYALTIPSEPVNVFCRENGEVAELKWDANPERDIVGYHVYKLTGGVWNIARVTDTPVNATTFSHHAGHEKTRYWLVAVDALGQEGQPSSPVWFRQSYRGFYSGEWHQ